MSIDDLIKTAIEMRAKAIAPYSGYKVGAMPCGACRQVIWDLCGNIPIYICDDSGLVNTLDTKGLLPHPFDKTKL